MNAPNTERRPARRSGFTFFELLVSLALVMVFVSLLAPAFINSRQAAQRTHCASNLAQIVQALHLYAADHDGVFPAVNDDLSPIHPTFAAGPSALQCPQDPKYQPPPPSGTPGATSAGPPASMSYRYRGGLNLEDGSREPLVWDRARWHQRGLNLATLSGQVVWSPKEPVLNGVGGKAGHRP
jgi:type II secretory pathway pseudopilin PulG